MRDAQNETLATLRKDLTQIGTYPILIEALIHHTKGWMKKKQTDYTHRLLPTVPTHNKLQLAIKQQNTIGWDHLVRGRLSKLWKDVQKLHNSTRLNQWSKHFIKYIQKINNTIWDARNNLIYGTGKEKITKEQKRLIPTITTFYNTYKHKISYKHFHIFQIPLQQRITFSPKENTQWIQTYKAAQKFYKREQKEFYIKHTKITKYFKQKKRKNTCQSTLGQTQGQNAKKTKIIAPKTKAPHGNTQTTMTTFCTKPPTPTDAPT